MTWDQGLVTVIGLGLIPLIIWYFWLSKGTGTLAQGSGLLQEVNVVVKGGYTPDTIIVRRNKPVRLNFLRQESATCSDTVKFPDFNKSARLPENETVTVELLPTEMGEFEFTCQMGMLRGRLIVEDT